MGQNAAALAVSLANGRLAAAVEGNDALAGLEAAGMPEAAQAQPVEAVEFAFDGLVTRLREREALA